MDGGKHLEVSFVIPFVPARIKEGKSQLQLIFPAAPESSSKGIPFLWILLSLGSKSPYFLKGGTARICGKCHCHHIHATAPKNSGKTHPT